MKITNLTVIKDSSYDKETIWLKRPFLYTLVYIPFYLHYFLGYPVQHTIQGNKVPSANHYQWLLSPTWIYSMQERLHYLSWVSGTQMKLQQNGYTRWKQLQVNMFCILGTNKCTSTLKWIQSVDSVPKSVNTVLIDDKSKEKMFISSLYFVKYFDLR